MFEPTVIIAGAALVGLTIVASALLRAWHGWAAIHGFFGWFYVAYFALTRPGGLSG